MNNPEEKKMAEDIPKQKDSEPPITEILESDDDEICDKDISSDNEDISMDEEALLMEDDDLLFDGDILKSTRKSKQDSEDTSEHNTEIKKPLDENIAANSSSKIKSETSDISVGEKPPQAIIPRVIIVRPGTSNTDIDLQKSLLAGPSNSGVSSHSNSLDNEPKVIIVKSATVNKVAVVKENDVDKPAAGASSSSKHECTTHVLEKAIVKKLIKSDLIKLKYLKRKLRMEGAYHKRKLSLMKDMVMVKRRKVRVEEKQAAALSRIARSLDAIVQRRALDQH